MDAGIPAVESDPQPLPDEPQPDPEEAGMPIATTAALWASFAAPAPSAAAAAEAAIKAFVGTVPGISKSCRY